MKRKVERLAQVETEARRLANSGDFQSFRTIRRELIAAGYEEARQIFRNPWTQSEINRLCDLAQPR